MTRVDNPNRSVRSIRAIIVVVICLSASPLAASSVPWVAVANDGRGFVLKPSGKPFIPWGFNYDRDYKFRLIEDYWDADWATVEQHFMQMKHLGANVVRVHLQLAKFMDAPDKANKRNLARLAKLVRLAESHGLYLDLTGLGSYREADAPRWYDAVSEQDRWTAQAHFWEAIASICAGRAGVFVYNVMNEPLVAGDKRLPGKWADPPSKMFRYRYREFINLDPAGRERSSIGLQWLRQMVRAIRKHDKRHLVTVGLVSTAVSGRPEQEAGFLPSIIAPELDYVSVHVYPASGKLDLNIDTLARYNIGKPVVIEEMFPLLCDVKELGLFIERSRTMAGGWMGFYWGQTPAELKGLSTPGAERTLGWLKLFEAMNPNR